jgi:hypothetical protein
MPFESEIESGFILSETAPGRYWPACDCARSGCPVRLLAAAETAVPGARPERWLGEKARAWRSLLAPAQQLIARRRAAQSMRHVSDYEVLRLFSGRVERRLLDTRLPATSSRRSCANGALCSRGPAGGPHVATVGKIRTFGALMA